MPILDIHTHHAAPQPEAVISVSLPDFHPIPAQLYSVGIHPWHSASDVSPKFPVTVPREKVRCARGFNSQSNIVAIGECGIDLRQGAPLYRQIQIFKEQIEISEQLQLPMIIHDVKAHEIILGIHADLNPRQNWVIHGFRLKPSVARMFTNRGIYLSFGEKFNPDTLRSVPRELILAETDDSPLGIRQIIANLSASMQEDLTPLIAQNTHRFLHKAGI